MEPLRQHLEDYSVQLPLKVYSELIHHAALTTSQAAEVVREAVQLRTRFQGYRDRTVISERIDPYYYADILELNKVETFMQFPAQLADGEAREYTFHFPLGVKDDLMTVAQSEELGSIDRYLVACFLLYMDHEGEALARG